MDQSEEQLDYEDEDRRLQEGEETIPEEEDYEDLYHDVNVGFISPPDPDLELDLNPSSAPENRTAIAESPPPDSPKDYGEANDGRQSFGAITQKAGRESNTGPAGTPTSAATSTPSRRGNCDYAGRDSGEKDGGGVLIVGELNWWTTDADLEASLSEYGKVKSIMFSEEKASGKCRGSCEVQFYEYACARACKEGMNGRVFNGRPCVVSLANSRTLRQIGDGMGYKVKVGNHQDSQSRRMMNDSGGGGGGRAGTGGGGGRAGTGGGGKASTGGGRLSGGGEGGRGRYYGRSNRGPSGYGGQGRGQGGQGRGRPVKGMGGGQVSANGGGQYGQVYLGSIGGGTMPPPMRNQGFDLAFGGQMGRGAGGGGVGYVGFAAHSSSHYPAMVHPFSPVGSVSLSGVAPHVNPAFIGQGMIGNGMGMVTSGSGMEGHHAGMWTDSSWGGDVHSRRMGESGYGEDMGSEYGYAEKNHDRGGRSNAQWNRDRSTENDRMGASGKRHRNDRETDWNGGRDRYREKERDGHQDQRERGRNWESERASRSRGRSHAMEEADQDDFSRELEYAKRRY